MATSYTPEQDAVISSKADRIKVKAFAGTGKTTTLRGFAEANPSLKILYLAFNKAIQTEAQAKFGSNVTARTSHSIAFGQVGRNYAAVPNKLNPGDIKPFHVLPQLQSSVRSVPQSAAVLYGARVIESIKAFLVSGDPELSIKHVTLGESPVERKHFSRSGVLADAMKVWAQMCDLKGPVPMIHDGYLKLFQLNGKVLPFDAVLTDEFQDTNPVTQTIIDKQRGIKVFVGDSHQAIYGFRGAFNAMDRVQVSQTFNLTGSFRFGPAVADVANAILAMKGEDVVLRGLGAPSVLDAVDESKTHAFIARGNSALFGRAVWALEKGRDFSFVGDIRNYRLDLIVDTFRLKEDGPANVKDPFLKSFESFTQLAEYAEMIGDKEVTGRCRLVEKYGYRIPGLVNQIETRAIPMGAGGDHIPLDAGRIILSSAHRSKGMEFGQVKLADDYAGFFDDETGKLIDLSRADQATIEEYNLQYVAATRAQKTLEVGESLAMYLDYLAEVEMNHVPTLA